MAATRILPTMNEKSNKLISLLKGLDKSARRRCRKLIQSPWFGGNEDLLSLYDEICKRLDKNRSLDKSEIWAKVLTHKGEFSDVRFRKYVSDLFKLVKEFLVQTELKRDGELHNYLYISGLDNAKHEKLVRGIERNWEGFLNDTEPREFSSDYYLYQHLLEQKKYDLLNYDHRPYTRSNVERVNYYLDAYFIITKLQYASVAISKYQIKNQNANLQMIAEIIEFLENNPYYNDIPIIAILKGRYLLLSGDNEDAYYRYKDLLKTYISIIPAGEAYQYVQAALNFCRRRVNIGGAKWAQEHTDTYKFAQEYNLIVNHGQIDPTGFRNTIMLALRAGQTSWVETYIRDYQQYLPEKQRQNAVTYNQASLHFYKKEYDAAQRLLNQVEYENVTYNLNSKVMLLAIYYETREYGLLDSLFDAISAYLNRHKELSPSLREAFSNLVSFTRRLTRLLPGDEKGLAALESDVAAAKYVASLPWLKEKLAEFS